MKTGEIVRRVDGKRLADDLWRLVQIPSPTCNEREAALVFAEMLTFAGADVELDESIHDSPCVIGRLHGNRPGRVLQLAGHIDHIDVPHAEAIRSDTIISGRGSYDMKAGLAVILETARLLKEEGCDFPGEILVTVYGLHEEPGGNTRGIMGPINRGIVGDAAIIVEGPCDRAVIRNNGLARWDVSFSQRGTPCHELNAAPERDELQKTLLAVINALREMDSELQRRPSQYPHLRRESCFIGQIHYGDFFNRMPASCRLQGTRRWQPDRSFAGVEEDMNALIEKVPHHPDASIRCQLTFIGHSYEIAPDEAIVHSLQHAHQLVTGKDLQVGPGEGVCDVQRLVREAEVPAVPWGIGGDPMHMGHTDEEYVELDKLRKSCQMILATALDYLDGGEVE